MALTPAEFHRMWAVGFPDRPLAFAAGVWTDGARQVEVRLEALPPRRIALLELARCRVRLSAPGLTAAAWNELLARFELSFRRGGG